MGNKYIKIWTKLRKILPEKIVSAKLKGLVIVGNRIWDFGQKKIGKGWSDLANLSLLRFGLKNSNEIGQLFSGRAASSTSAVVVGVHVHIGVHVVIVVVVVIVIVVVDVDWNFKFWLL